MNRLKPLMAAWDRPTVASIVAFAVLLAAYLALDAAGFVAHDSAWTTPAVALTLACALCALAARPYLLKRFEPLARRAKPFVLVALVALAFYLFEKPYNPGLFGIGAFYAFVNLCVIAVLFAIVYFAFQQTKASAVAFLALCFIAGTANYFVIAFKGQPVLPADIFALSTAAAVGGGYTYVINDDIATAFAALAAGIVLVAYLPKTKFALKRGVANGAVALVCVLGFGAWFSSVDIEHAYGVQVDGWAASSSYSQQGSVLCFLKRVQDLSPAAPEGYSHDAAAEILSRYETSDDEARGTDETGYGVDGEMPAVVAIMNETFSDLSLYPNLADIYDGPVYFNSISDAYLKGTAYASALGAGTCNSEFEFLTGATMANLGDGVYPYMLYDLEGTGNLASYFNNLGYDTTAIHPADATNWRRDTVYSQLGFDEFFDVTDFEGADTLRGFTTDKATYDLILERLATDENPQFIFDVTLQNHGGYDTGLIPNEMAVSVPLESDRTAELEEFVSCIRQSDLDLQYLIEGLSELDRPVVLCIFGDHQPGFSDWLASLAFGKDVSDFTLEEVQARYEVPYLIWTNFESDRATKANAAALAEDMAPVLDELERPLYQDGTDMSLNYLSAHLLAAAQLPLPAYQQFLLDAQQTIPVINLNGYRDDSGLWHWSDGRDEDGVPESIAATLGELAIVQHNLLFGS
ncbi:LTA synthase family protein [Raoultibacter phocaeensis]|uniref:LTA synthase family protein n=1 Tax=Raoultibacter phocaeensis TaxID=2479841 RepID=UPI0015D65133|nr:LTA synthase family protein [Raoultibacter phocaeensis]